MELATRSAVTRQLLLSGRACWALALLMISGAGCDDKQGAQRPEVAKAPAASVPYIQGNFDVAQLKMCATELWAKGKWNHADYLGRMADIRVSEDMVVTGVPVELINACARIAAEEGAPDPNVDEISVDIVDDDAGPAKRTQAHMRAKDEQSSARVRSARAIAIWFTMLTYVKLGADGWKTGPLKAIRANKYCTFPSEGRPGAIFNGGEQPGLLSFAALLKDFDPDVPVTTDDARTAAEQLVWMKTLGMCDGTHQTLSEGRRLIQAAVLGPLVGFDIGDCSDPDPEKRQAAIKKLQEGRRKLCSGRPGMKLNTPSARRRSEVALPVSQPHALT